MAQNSAPARVTLSFSRFELVPGERLLTADGAPVDLGARTLDLLIALASRPNEVVSKRELMAEVWPDVTVEEGSLRFHMASLRKALGEGKAGARYIATLAGRGYCFVAPVIRSGEVAGETRPPVNHAAKANFLPARLSRMVGRTDGVQLLAKQVATSRLVTIVGSGGVGKTTVAVALAYELPDVFAGAIVFVDLGMLSDPDMVCTSLASILGVSIQSDDAIPSLLAFLSDKRMLVILDNCEHVIDAAAQLSAAILKVAPALHILATSREALRIEGEQVHRLMPLGVPPDMPGLTAPIALTYPAIQLFVERAAACGAPFALTDADAVTVAHICRKLDGVALAIELAAGRVEAYGLQQTALLLDQHLALLWLGQRTAPPRQKTLQATLDWSYGLLSDLERVVFRRLAIFVGEFTLEAALAVVTSPRIAQAPVFDAIGSLVTKSLVANRPLGATMRYRLLDTTRAYALSMIGKEADSDADLTELAAQHAAHYRHWLEQTGPEWATLSSAAERAPYLASLGNVRAALDWCFGSHGDAAMGIGLAAAAVPVLLVTSLLGECLRWSQRSLVALTDADRGGVAEMRLQAALGLSLMFTKGNSEEVRAALARGLDLAEGLGDLGYQLQLLGALHLFHERIGAFRESLAFAERSVSAAGAIGDAVAIGAAHSWLGISHHLMGHTEAADTHLATALASPRVSRRFNTIQIGFDYHNRARITLARNLWLRGYPDAAARTAIATVAEAAELEHPVTLCMALIWAVTVFVWRREWLKVEEHVDRFIAVADRYSLAPYQAAGLGVKGELSIRRGEVMAGIQSLHSSLVKLHADRYELLTTELVSALAEGLAMTGRSEEALATIAGAIERAESYGRLFTLPELLRLRGMILATMPRPDRQAAEMCMMQSLQLSRHQGARGWELRTAIDLATFWASQDRLCEARAVLQPVFAGFTEGSDTPDLMAAARLLARFG